MLVAVELALGAGPPGKVSVERAVNVVSRLNAVLAPPTADTHLKASTPPLVDTARYDKLHDDSSVDDTVETTVNATTEGAGLEA